MTSLTRNFRFAALSLATILLAVGPALAASMPTAPDTVHLMTTNAQLNHTLNSNKVSVGQRVMAHLTMKLRTRHGFLLPRNTQLIGKVALLERGHGKRTRIALRFDQARLKDGRVIPIKATLLGALPPVNAFDGGQVQYLPDTSHPVSPKAQVDQEAGVLHNIALHAAVRSSNSGTFLSKRKKIDLAAGTQLRLAIAPLHNSTTKTG